jgi:hypothetical protein
VLVEQPVITLPSDEWGDQLGLASVLRLIEGPNASKIIHDLEHFHPTKLVVDGAGESSQKQVADMLDLLGFRSVTPTAAVSSPHQRHTTVTAQDRNGRSILLALHNGLRQNIYHVTEPFDQPTAKFLPKPTTILEVRTTRGPAESLTIPTHFSMLRYIYGIPI